MFAVALYARAWVEILRGERVCLCALVVALYARAWVEIAVIKMGSPIYNLVALYARAWVEIFSACIMAFSSAQSPSTRGRG